MKDLIVLVAVSVTIGFALGGLKASAPPSAAPEPTAPPLPRPGLYLVTEQTGPDMAEPDWILSGCGPRCLRARAAAGTWQMDLSWNAAADRHRGAWVGERIDPGMRCWAGAPDEYQRGPVPLKYVVRADLTGFVNMKFTRENPSCRGETEMRGREFTLQRAKSLWS